MSDEARREAAGLFALSKLSDPEWQNARVGNITDAFMAGWDKRGEWEASRPVIDEEIDAAGKAFFQEYEDYDGTGWEWRKTLYGGYGMTPVVDPARAKIRAALEAFVAARRGTK